MNQGGRALRLTSTIIAVFLALSMAIFPITMVRAAAMGGHSHQATTQADHGHQEHLASSGEDCSSAVTPDTDSSPAGDAAHTSGPSCCGMGACHAFQLNAAPSVFTPARSAQIVHAFGDEQVSGAFLVRIDRPPRTV